MHADARVVQFFLGIASLLFLASLFGYVFHRLKMPKVVGEIFGGALLGPLCFGRVQPDLFRALFGDNEGLLSAFSLLGLLLLMFASGFEMDPAIERDDRQTILTIIVTSTAVPLALGWLVTGFFDVSKLLGPANHQVALKLVIAIAIAITSIPVISKIFIDLRIMDTRFARVVLGIATGHDIILWVLLSYATGIVNRAALSPADFLVQAGTPLLFFLGGLLVAPLLIGRVLSGSRKVVPQHYEASFVFLTLFGFVLLAYALGVNIIFGAFLAGIVVGVLKTPAYAETKRHIQTVSFAFFVPVYFAIVGLRLDLGGQFDLPFFLAFTVFAIVVQGLTVFGTARILGHGLIPSTNLAMAINARGGPCIVLATVAYDAKIIGAQFFTALVLLAIVTSLISGAWLRFVLSRDLGLYD